MSGEFENSNLMVCLKQKNGAYFQKVIELRDSITGWLEFIPQTFPHYTRHTIAHSDEIIGKLSNLLFEGIEPVINLSYTEMYILAASAYLHDAGMVASDKEKSEIFDSGDWRKWTTNTGGGAKRIAEIEKFRLDDGIDKDKRNFLADVQMRFLIAEFLRRTHHRRASRVMMQHQSVLGRFAFDNDMLLETINSVCVAHGLRQHELRDDERFPERRLIRNDMVNVRFMAILLRIGDLLDMSNDRACPLLMNAACPLPADSLAHWTQYKRIKHFMVAPDKIEIRAECNNQKEHQVLQDWCQWLVEETIAATTIMTHAERLSEWQCPEITLFDDGSGTIVIRPAEGASYIPSRWILKLDNEAIFERLIKDAYEDTSVFIRELIQNALDANRCQMYIDAETRGIERPEYPTQFEENVRNRYPVKIGLEEKKIKNEISGDEENVQVLTVEDCGIGMDRDIIEHYFLQIGRSYYITDAFRRLFTFVPTSRFGIGFLSVFAVSDHVTVETYKPGAKENRAYNFTLTGPKSYLLTEEGKRRKCGTRIEVRLRETMKKGELNDLISGWCRRVEFPIIVDDLGVEKKIIAEKPEDFECEVPDITRDGAKFIVRCFDINRDGIEGELYVLAHITDEGESWTKTWWAIYEYPKTHPAAITPKMPDSIECLHGISVYGHAGYAGAMCRRLDYRNANCWAILSRKSLRTFSLEGRIGTDVESRWEEILLEHMRKTPLSKGDQGWRYKQNLIHDFPLMGFWRGIDGTIGAYVKGQIELVSIDYMMGLEELTLIFEPRRINEVMPDYDKKNDTDPSWDNDLYTIIDGDKRYITADLREMLFRDRLVKKVRWLDSGHLAVDLIAAEHNKDEKNFDLPMGINCRLMEYSDVEMIGGGIRNIFGFGEMLLINTLNPFAKWAINVQGNMNESQLQGKQLKTLFELMAEAIQYKGYTKYLCKLSSYVDSWRLLPGLTDEVYPPEIELTKEMFCWTSPK